jgi:hypothetical protein
MNNGHFDPDQSTFSWAELHVKASALPACDKDSPTHAETSCSLTWQSLIDCARNGLCGKMSPVFCQATEDGILAPSSGRWFNSGMGSRTECLTLNTCEWGDGPEPSRSAGDVCSLSDVLETGPLPEKYSLSKKACEGILRRSQRRAKVLPPMLKAALLAASQLAR